MQYVLGPDQGHTQTRAAVVMLKDNFWASALPAAPVTRGAE